MTLRVLCKKSTYVAYATKLAKDLFTADSKLIYRYLSTSSDIICSCTLDLLAAMTGVGLSSAEFLYENFDFSLRCFNFFPNHRRPVVLEPFTGVAMSSRIALVSFICAFFTQGHYDVKLGVVKMSSLMSPVLSGLMADGVDQVLYFLNICEQNVLFHEQQHSKTMTAAFLSGNNASSLTKLLHSYDNPAVKTRVLEILNRFASAESPFNCIYRVDRLSSQELTCIRNRSLQAILGNLNIFQSVDQLQLALKILEACPDLVGPFLRGAKFSFDPEYTVKWLTLCSFLTKVARLRPDQAVEIEKSPSMEYLISAICPARAALNRAILSDSALIKLYALQLLVAILEKLSWCVSSLDEEISACEAEVFGMIESGRRLESLQQARSETIEAVARLLPDWQTIQSVLNGLIAGKEVSSTGQLDALLPGQWKEELLTAGLDCARFYIGIFVAEEDALEQAHFEDPLKFVAPLLEREVQGSSALMAPILRFCAAFPRFSPADTPAWHMFLGRLCDAQKTTEHSALASLLLSSIFYSSGLFLNREQELESLVACLDAERASVCLREILHLGKRNVFPETGHSPLIQRLLETDHHDFAQRVIASTEQKHRKRVKIEGDVKLESSSSDSDSDSDSSDSDSDIFEKQSKQRIQIDLPDPQTTAPAVLVSQLLSHVDRIRMNRFCSAFPCHRRLLTQPQRRRVNENMLKDLLYGPDDFAVFCNWVALLGGFIGKLPKGSLDVHALTASNLLGAFVMGLSSEDGNMRRVCGALLTWIVQELCTIIRQNDKVIQVYALLRCLQRSVDLPEDAKDQPRLSPVVALLFAQIFPILLTPEHALFPTLAGLAHNLAYLRLARFPLFDQLIRGTDLDPESIVDRRLFVKQLCWLLKVVEYGCKEPQDLTTGPIKTSRVLETVLSLFHTFAVDARKNAESERAVSAIVKVAAKLVEIDAAVMQKECGIREWAAVALDVLKANTKPSSLEEVKRSLAALK